jgi:diacylglycerol kinase (ATP)
VKRARLIYNPTAGRELMAKNLSKILDCLEKAGYETSCKSTEDQWGATVEANLAAERKFDVVIAAGGDGTIHEVINGLAPHPHPPKLGILPAGTSNDFARTLKIPKHFIKACEVIATGKTKPIDVGKFKDRYFINVAAAGRITQITYEVPSSLKTMMGSLAYYMKAFEKMGTLLKSFPIHIQSPQLVWEAEILLIIVSNGISVGGFEKLAPLADLSDGLLDVLIIPKMSISEYIHIVTLALKGQHIKDSRVIYFQTDQLDIKTSSTLKLNMDGEWAGDITGRFEVLPNHLEVFLP